MADETETGSQLFKRWLTGPPKRSQAEVAGALGIAQQTISAWARGGAVPGVLHRVRLKVLTGIPTDAWVKLDGTEAEHLSEAEERELLAASKKDVA
jgi:transcriptional regulator with XRE-family HTH domain